MAEKQSEKTTQNNNAMEPRPIPAESFMETKIAEERARARKAEQAKKNVRSTFVKAGGKIGKKAAQTMTPALGPIGGFAAKKIAERATGKAFDKLDKRGKLKPLDEAAQAATINREKKGKEGAPEAKDIGKQLAKKTIKKALMNPATWATIGVALFWLAIGIGLTFILFIMVMMGNCAYQKGTGGTAWTLYRGGATQLFMDAFSTKCLPDGTAAKPNEPATKSTDAPSGQGSSDTTDAKTPTE